MGLAAYRNRREVLVKQINNPESREEAALQMCPRAKSELGPSHLQEKQRDRTGAGGRKSHCGLPAMVAAVSQMQCVAGTGNTHLAAFRCACD